MQSRVPRGQEELFVASSLGDLVPEDHVLKRVHAILDLSWIHEEVRSVYCQFNGRPSIDPESALRLMLAGFFQGITQDRKLMREAQVNLAIRWFAGFRLDEKLPERSVLTRIRQRWGAQRFERIFTRTVRQCMEAGLVSMDTVHVDATLIRADVSWDSLKKHHVGKVIEENGVTDEEEDADSGPPASGKKAKITSAKVKKYSTTDPDATMATSCRKHRLEPSFKQHTAVEDSNGIIVDVSLTTGEASEGKQLLNQIERIEQTAGAKIGCVTCDGGYAHCANYAALEERGTDAIIPPQKIRRPEKIPLQRFKYDEHHDHVTCPAGKRLRRASRASAGNGNFYRAKTGDCANCPLRARGLSPKAARRSVLIVDSYPALMRARRRKEKGWDKETRAKYKRHGWRVEGAHGRAKSQHGLERAARRGLEEVSIQMYLTAAVMNLKKIAAVHAAMIALRNPLARLIRRLAAMLPDKTEAQPLAA